MEEFAAATPGAVVEVKSSSVAWHYRLAGRGFGRAQARELTLTPAAAAKAGLPVKADGQRRDLIQLLAYPSIGFDDLARMWPQIAAWPGEVREQIESAFHALAKIERRRFELDLTGLDLRHVQDVINDGQQRFAAGANRLDRGRRRRPRVHGDRADGRRPSGPEGRRP